MSNEVTEAQYKEAERVLRKYAEDMNAGKAHPGDWREDVTEAQEIMKKWGVETEYKYEDGKQRLYVGGRLNY